MINVLFAADFPITRTGIASTASGILAEWSSGEVNLLAIKPLTINDEPARVIECFEDQRIDLVFTHLEYSGLANLVRLYPNALYHVGDWSVSYWHSVYKKRKVKGVLGLLRCSWRLRSIDRNARFLFVTKEDYLCALAYGFERSKHLPIGVRPPVCPISNNIDFGSLYFSGNFCYEPNYLAATRLLKLAHAEFPQLKIIIVGFNAEVLDGFNKKNIEIYSNVPSVVDFLAGRRPIYVSLVETGAGAKNKILEAIVSGCPILCTAESLDVSISESDSLKIVIDNVDLIYRLRDWLSEHQKESICASSMELAERTISERSWASVAKMLHQELIDS